MDFRDYANRLTDPIERERVLQALDDAANTPIATELVYDIEARYGDGAGLIDVDSFIKDELGKRPGRTEFEALMRAAALLQIRMAFKKLESSKRPRGRATCGSTSSNSPVTRNVVSALPRGRH